MPNIWHLAHQTPKKTIMRCVKCQKILRHAIVCSHLWHDTDENAKPNKSFFIQLFLSPLNILFNFFSLSPTRVLSLSSSDHQIPSPPHPPSLIPSPSPIPLPLPSLTLTLTNQAALTDQATAITSGLKTPSPPV